MGSQFNAGSNLDSRKNLKIEKMTMEAPYEYEQEAYKNV